MLALFFLSFSFLAVRALTFNITVNNQILFPSDILAIPDSPVKTACNTNCTDASAKLTACKVDDTQCFCGADTVASLLACETCMFQFLINANKPAPDFRAGSNPVLAAYSAACLEGNVTLAANQTALILPSTWNGPFEAILPVGGVGVTVTIGAVIGISALLILSNL